MTVRHQSRTRLDLQVALDRLPPDAALEIVRAVAPLVDWIEVGTSMIKGYGAAYLTSVVEAAASTPVLADLKTADDARWEFTMAFDAGARSATVLGLAADATIDTAVAVAAERGCEAVIDLMGVPAERLDALARRLPAEVVLAAHIGKDTQDGRHGATGVLGLLGPWARGRRIALAGGLDVAALSQLRDGLGDILGDDVQGADSHDGAVRVIVGSAVTGAADPRDAVRRLLTATGTETRS
jgi:3-hexulose-6-phosphate synthase